MTLIDINANNEDDIVRFVEVSEQPENVEQFQIIESVRNTKPFQPEVGPKDNKMCFFYWIYFLEERGKERKKEKVTNENEALES